MQLFICELYGTVTSNSSLMESGRQRPKGMTQLSREKLEDPISAGHSFLLLFSRLPISFSVLIDL